MYDLLSNSSSTVQLREFENVSMAGLSHLPPQTPVGNGREQKRHLFAYTPSNIGNSRFGFELQSSKQSDSDSDSMCSLGPPTPGSNQGISQQASTNFSQEDWSKRSSFGKKFLALDMAKVAEVDDTFVVAETEFEGSTHSADEFKELILNTNFIINKNSSFGKREKRPVVMFVRGDN